MSQVPPSVAQMTRPLQGDEVEITPRLAMACSAGLMLAEEPVARAAGLPRPIVHGTILWALAGVRLADLWLDGAIDQLKRHGARFQAPVLPSATLHATGEARIAEPVSLERETD